MSLEVWIYIVCIYWTIGSPKVWVSISNNARSSSLGKNDAKSSPVTLTGTNRSPPWQVRSVRFALPRHRSRETWARNPSRSPRPPLSAWPRSSTSNWRCPERWKTHGRSWRTGSRRPRVGCWGQTGKRNESGLGYQESRILIGQHSSLWKRAPNHWLHLYPLGLASPLECTTILV